MGLFGSIIGGVAGLIGGNKKAKAAKKAAQLEYDAALKGIEETGRQFDLTRADFAPYQALGASAVDNLGNLVGVNGGEAQGSEIAALRSSPLYQALYTAGEESVLQNASATGGLRGGNTTQSLYRLGEDTLSSLIERQIANYGGLVGIGSGASGAVGNFGANAVAQSAALRGQGAQALGTGKLISGVVGGNTIANLGTSIEDILGSILSGGGAGGGGYGGGFAGDGSGGFNFKSLAF